MSWIRYVALSCWAFSMCPILSAEARAEEQFRVGDPLPQSVVDTWERRRRACERVYWKLKTRHLITAGSLNMLPHQPKDSGPIPKEDIWREREFELWIDFANHKARIFTHGLPNSEVRDGEATLSYSHRVWLYDGESLQEWQPNEENGVSAWYELRECDPDGRGSGLAVEASVLPFFWGRGMISGGGGSLRLTDFDTRVDPSKCRIHAVKHEGDSTHLVVRTRLIPQKPKYFLEYEIDLGKDCAVTRMSRYSGTRVTSETRAVWAKSDDGWQPTSWTGGFYKGGGELFTSRECEVLALECGADLSAVQFHISPEPGTRYWDEKTDETYVKSAGDGRDVPAELYEIRQDAGQRRLRWIASIAVVGIVLAGAVWWRRRH